MKHRIDAGVLIDYWSPRLKTRRPTRLGAGAILRSGTVLYEGSVIGPGLETGHHAVIREECRLGRGVRLWNNSTIDYGCRIGRGVKIHCNCYIAQYSRIDDDAFLAPGVIFANDLYPGFKISCQRMRGPWIGRGAQIGVNATVLPFVKIGPKALIGAGSVVTRDIPAGAVAWGNPARALGRVENLKPAFRLRRLLNR